MVRRSSRSTRAGSLEKWIDDPADKVEIEHLCNIQVLVPQSEFQGEITGSLTTKMVRDWRLKSDHEYCHGSCWGS